MKIKKAILRGSKPQVEFINCKDPYPAFVGGFASGKTFAGISRTIKQMFSDNCPQAYYLPTYDLVKRIAFPRFEEMLDSLKIQYKINKADHVLKPKGFQEIIFRTLDRPERIVGYEVGHSIVDEFDTLKTVVALECWNKIISRNRYKIDGVNSVGVVTTPEGFRATYQLWQKEVKKGYHLIKASTYSNAKNIPDDYIPNLLSSYPEELIQAYINGEFVNLNAGIVYNKFDRKRNDIKRIVLDDDVLHIGIDFNVEKMSAVVGVFENEELYIVDEFYKSLDTAQMIKAIKNRYPNHQINVYPDSSGKNRKSNDSSKTDISLLMQAGFRVLYKSKNPFVRDRINNVNRCFLDSNEKIRLYINEYKCKNLCECLEQLAYNNGVPDKQSDFDHLPDALGYLVMYKMPINERKVFTGSTV